MRANKLYKCQNNVCIEIFRDYSIKKYQIMATKAIMSKKDVIY